MASTSLCSASRSANMFVLVPESSAGTLCGAGTGRSIDPLLLPLVRGGGGGGGTEPWLASLDLGSSAAGWRLSMPGRRVDPWRAGGGGGGAIGLCSWLSW